ncbi:MAG: disulfide reductase [Methanocellales archaeon]|nr:disulfide reductase [Methanocellales archaeon]
MNLAYTFAYYPGCYLHASAGEYDMSTMAVCELLGIQLIELDDWNCCGALEASNPLTLSLSARNLALAEKEGLDILAPCSICFNNLSRANNAVRGGGRTKTIINKATGENYQGEVEVRHLLDVIVNDIGLDNISNAVKVPLEGLRSVPYYGCLTIRPSDVSKFEDPEIPRSLDDIIEALGADCLQFKHKKDCCGGNLLLSSEDFSLQITKEILSEAKELGADCVTVACPLCHAMLDYQQSKIESKYDIVIDLPILYFTQLMGLALGLREKELGLNKNFVSTVKLRRR